MERLGSEAGATAVEYAIVAALIAAVVVVAVAFLGQETLASYECFTDGLSQGASAC